MKTIKKAWGWLNQTQVRRFLVSGQAVMAVDIVVYYLFLLCWGDDGYIKANYVSSTASSLANFFMQKFWVFNDRRPGMLWGQISAFSISTVAFTFGGNLVLWTLVEGIHMGPMWAKWTKIAVMGVVSWFVSSKAIFKGEGP